ncbi:nucleotidyltransferase domain-containing protein [Catenulispora subtropica]|uniref:Polymerase nucleotidyl transferase domain-containing protein n=1 Tax=Catenulispora subtropica TaxID=450798 RepID=A0ABN2T6K8_9ACTN
MPDDAVDRFLDRVVEVLRSDHRVLGAWLTGSHARGTADRHSDIDLWLVVRPETRDEFVADWPRLSDEIAPSVLRQRVFGSTFLHITAQWRRWDVSIGVPDDVPSRSVSTLKPLLDRAGLNDRVGPPGEPRAPDPGRISALTTEFLRVMGLLPVVLGRREYVVGVSGAGLLRGLIIQLFVEDAAVEDRGGALHLNSLLPPERLRLLTDLPTPAANSDSVTEAHLACAGVFLPAARELASRTGAEWPSELETALRRRLRSELGIALP